MNQETLEWWAKRELIRLTGVEALRKQKEKQVFAAAKALHKAIKAGEFPKAKELKCSHCPRQAAQYHHHNGYDESHWLDVIPLCLECHKAADWVNYERCRGIKKNGEPCGWMLPPGHGGYCFTHLSQRFTPLEVTLAKEIVTLKTKLKKVSNGKSQPV